MKYVTTRRGKLALGLLAGGALLMTVPTLYAATGQGSAVVEIFTALSVVETTPLNFGLIGEPTVGAAEVIVASDGTATFNDNGSEAVNGGGQAAGEYLVSGAPNNLVNVSAAITSPFGDGNLTLRDLTLSAAQVTLDGTTGEATVTIGGSLDIAAGVALGVHNDAVIDVTVNYN